MTGRDNQHQFHGRRTQARRHFVRIGSEHPGAGVMRFYELAALVRHRRPVSRPAVLHAEPGVLVTEFIEGKTLGEEDFRDEAMLRPGRTIGAQLHVEVARPRVRPGTDVLAVSGRAPLLRKSCAAAAAIIANACRSCFEKAD